MKLRIKGNSLRLRLTRSEVTQLATTGLVESSTDFGSQTFRYALTCHDGASLLTAECNAQTITVRAARAAVIRWAAGEDIGLYGQQAAPTGEPLTIAVEKDFRCLDPHRDEDESDHFEHPLAEQGHHAVCAGESA